MSPDESEADQEWRYGLNLATAGWWFAASTILFGPIGFVATCIVANRLMAARRVTTGALTMLLSMVFLAGQAVYALSQLD